MGELNIFSFHKIPNCIFHTADILVVYVHLWEGGIISKLTNKFFSGEINTKVKGFMANVILVHEISESITEPTTIFRVDVELRL